MSTTIGVVPSRRSFLVGATALAATAWTSGRCRPADASTDRRLTAGSAQVQLLEPPSPKTAVWAYDATVPGPTLRVRRGESLRIVVENRLAEETTVQWHG